eukprot:scaffold6864_cov36-Phaeocystis_antarctica.AAC.1
MSLSRTRKGTSLMRRSAVPMRENASRSTARGVGRAAACPASPSFSSCASNSAYSPSCSSSTPREP